MSKSSVEIVRLEPLCLRPAQAAKLIGVSLRKYHSMRSCGLLPPMHKLGSCLVILTEDLRNWVRWGFPNLDKFVALKSEENKK